MTKLFGYTNKMLAEINAHILKNQNLLKFLYYTDYEYCEKDILIQENVSSSKIYNKKFFVYNRIPEIITEEGAFMYIDIYRSTPTSLGSKIRDVTFTVNILVHNNCISTIHGNRAICIYSAIEESLTDYVKKSSIGSVDILRVSPLLGLVKEFSGYAVQFRAYGFKDTENIRGILERHDR